MIPWSVLLGITLPTVGLSWLLLEYPQILHKRKKYRGNRFDSVVIAHRGARLEGVPENTLAAFEHAVESNADMIELDVWQTTDKQAVVFHDPTTSRMTGKDVRIAESRYEDLPPIVPPSPEQGHKLGPHNHHQAIKIPRFHEVLAVLPADMPLIVEFKAGAQELVQKVFAAVADAGKVEGLVWFSLQEKINQTLREAHPEVPRITSVFSMIKYISLYWMGLLPFFAVQEDIFGVPIDKVDYARIRGNSGLKSLPDFACYLIFLIFGGDPPEALMPRKLMHHMRKRGLPVWFLNVNTPGQVDAAIDLGATGFVTDCPELVRNYLLQKYPDFSPRVDYAK